MQLISRYQFLTVFALKIHETALVQMIWASWFRVCVVQMCVSHFASALTFVMDTFNPYFAENVFLMVFSFLVIVIEVHRKWVFAVAGENTAPLWLPFKTKAFQAAHLEAGPSFALLG